MALKQSFYDGGRHSRDCEICGNPVPRVWGARLHKCHKCAQKIAKDVSEEFEENKGHYLTQSIMQTGNDNLIDAVCKGAQIAKENEQLPKPEIEVTVDDISDIAQSMAKLIEEKEDDKS